MSMISWLVSLWSCGNTERQQTTSDLISQNALTFEIDKNKRDALVLKYDLLNFPNYTTPIFLTLDEFFNGNNDDASIAPNLDTKLKVSEYYKTLKNIENDKDIQGAYAELKDVMIYENNQLNDNEWFYTDVIYFIGELTKEEIAKRVKKLQPDEVEYIVDERLSGLSKEYKGKKIVYVWWD